MTYLELLSTLREPPCSPEYIDSLVMPFGAYQGTKLVDLCDFDPDFFAKFRFVWLNKKVEFNTEYINHNTDLAYALYLIWNEKAYENKYNLRRIQDG